MYSLDNESGVAVMPTVKAQRKPANEPQWFTEGGNGVAPSYPGADWFNIVQAELLEVLREANIQPDKNSLNQLVTAIKAIITTSTTNKASSVHTHTWSSITGKPTTFTPSSHTHTISNITGLQEALNGKAASNHTHTWSSITGKPTTFTPSSHTHAITNITGLQEALNEKIGKSGGTMTGNLIISNGDYGTVSIKNRTDNSLILESATDNQTYIGTITYRNSNNIKLAELIIPKERRARILTTSSISIISGTVISGGTLPLPAGFTQNECKWILSLSNATDGRNGSVVDVDISVNPSNRVVTALTQTSNGTSNRSVVSYIVIGMKSL